MRADWSELLLHRCGLALRDSQVPVFAELLQSRAAALGLDSCTSYYDVLQSEEDTGTEWSEVVDRLVSHETMFFRHDETFEAIRADILPELRRRPAIGGNTLALCSAGCSTGEEAYTLAMIAAGEEVPECVVWGIDLSRRALDTARRARYSTRAVAHVPLAYRRHLTQVGPVTFDVTEDIKRRVKFVAANLFVSCGMFMHYDLIVCQNVLIYFAPAAVPRALAMLASRLTPGGFLVLGPGEAASETPEGLVPAGINGVRAFRRVRPAPREVRS
jgi:chemotaxis methyl-accepting protein methylase